MKTEWRGFKGTHWVDDVDVRDFVQNNYTPYDGDDSFLEPPTEATSKLWDLLQGLQKEERAKGGVLDMETEIVSGITAYKAAYMGEGTKDLEKVVGLQTDKPLKRAFMPFGGIKMAEQACETYGYKPNPKFHKIFTEYHKTHNQGVYDAYTPEMRLARKNKIITGLPDTYGRGRIVGDYRRVALYGIDFLIAKKKEDMAHCGCGMMTDEIIRQREEITDQIRALMQMKEMAADYDEVMERFDKMMDWLAGLYVNTLNLIHYMHDKYYYEAAELALIDTDVRRTFATGIAGFSHVVDSLCAIKYAKVKTVRNDQGVVIGYETEGDFPRYGNDDDRADSIAVWLLKTFMKRLRKFHTYRNSEPTTSILTITSNVVYGKATGDLPDGRKSGEPLSPGANPSYGAEQNGLLASLNSVAKLPYEYALDGISNTQTISPDALGHSLEERVNNLVRVMDGYFERGAHHLNVNIFGTEKLIDAMEHPEKPEYANFTIRVSGYAVKFIDLTREQQLDVISRTCHKAM